MLDPNSGRRRKTILNALGTLIALVLLVVLLRSQGWEEIRQAIRAIPAWRLGLAFLVTMVSRLAVIFRWHVLLVSAEMGVSLWQSLQITFAGLFASQFLPTTVGGDVIRLAGLLRLGKDRAASLASLVVDRLVGMTGMGMAALVLIVYLPNLFQDLFANLSGFWTKVTGFLWLGFTASSSKVSFFRKIWNWFLRGLRKVGQALMMWSHKPGSLLLSLGFTWVHMLCVFAFIWLLLPPLGENMPFGLIGGLWSLTYFITLLPISLNGLGVQELSFTFLFTHFGGIDQASSLTIALLYRFALLFASLPGVLTIPGMISGRIGKNAVQPKAQDHDLKEL
jgi:glycosyltransferase 2 family protein